MLIHRFTVITLFACIAIVLCPGTASSQNDKPKATPGIKVGQKAPAFKLKNQDGKEVSLKELGKDGKDVALVFYRSADW